MVDAVLLEWEGVLADTRTARRDALRAALAAEGIAHSLSDDDEQVRGLGVHAAARTILRHMGSSDATLAELLALRASRAFADMVAQGVVLVPGARECVARLQARGRIAIVTRAARAETESVLRLAGLDHAVTTIVAADDASGDAPSAEGYRRALEQLSRVRRADAPVAVVDAVAPARAARAAGVRVLVVGAPAHEAVEGDAAVDSLGALDLDALFPLAGPRGGREHA